MNYIGLFLMLFCVSGVCLEAVAQVSDKDSARIAEAVSSVGAIEPAAPRKLLVLYRCDGFRHSSIPYANRMLELASEKTGAFDAVFSDGMDIVDKERLKNFDGVLLNNTTRLKFENQAQRDVLLDFVRAGKGLIGIHAATDNFYDFPEAAEMIGGLFDGHPWGAGGTWGMKIDEPNHPLVAAFNDSTFEIRDEIYQIKGPYSRDTHRVLISLNMEHPKTAKQGGQKRQDRDNPVSWIKRYGSGRVFYCSLGHNHDVFWNERVVAHYLAGIQYALGDLEVDDRPSSREDTEQ